MSEYEKMLEALMKKYMDEGMTEFDARMKVIMSDESLARVYPALYDEEKEEV